ncbi:hypothetical protein F5Y08DRAFT_348426 [Xylaria arbuscula]|nr:hypothetical protein F5Y08DRAFT_348426 [Xylaria arbuscula]
MFYQDVLSRRKQGDNPAEWMLDITNMNVKSDPQNQSSGDWTQKRNSSQQKQDLLNHLAGLNATHPDTAESLEAPEGAYATSFAQQTSLVTKCMFIDQWRTPIYLFTKIVVPVGTALPNGFCFLNTSLNLQSVVSILF